MGPQLVITVDADLRSDTVATRRETLDVLLGVFEDTGVAGNVTWFLNENDFHITENHEDFLREALRRGDTLGVHDHVDFLSGHGCRREPAIHTYCERSLRILRRWLRENGFPDHLPYHRMGCFYVREACYRALERLGYTVVSNGIVGRKELNHAGDLSCDCRHWPPACPPFRHDAHNFTDCHSRAGRFLNFPVFHMGIADVDFSQAEKWIAVANKDGRECPPFVWCFHPYEVCVREDGGGRNQVDPSIVETFRGIIRRFTKDLGASAANLETCAKVHGT